MKNFLWFVVGLLIASGGVLAQNMTLTEQLLTTISSTLTSSNTTLTNINTNVSASIPAGTNAIGSVQTSTLGSKYQHVAASQTAAALSGGGGGATGDYLSHCVIYPSTTAAGSVTVFDNTNAAANNVIEFTTGTLSNLAPIAIPVGATSINGAWKVTTGANETVVCYGKFT